MKKLMYHVVEYSPQGQLLSSIEGLSERQAIKAAKIEAAKITDGKSQIFIEWYRSSDGQHGYVNPDGNHAITGHSW
jgi:hypothetical protein